MLTKERVRHVKFGRNDFLFVPRLPDIADETSRRRDVIALVETWQRRVIKVMLIYPRLFRRRVVLVYS